MSRKSRNQKIQKPKSELDICLLTCGLVDVPVFEKCIEAIVREGKEFNAQIYIYMNGVDKESKPLFENVMRPYQSIHVKQTNERVGFPAGANRAIRQGTSPLFLFITDDIILHPGSLKIMMDRMKADEKIGVCGMKLLFPEDSTDKTRPAGRVQHIGHGIDIRGKVTHPLMGWKPDNKKCNISREVSSVTGGVFLCKKVAFNGVGGFFEGYGLGYYEDVDFNLSVRALGYKIWIETEAVGTHYTNMSMLRSEIKPNLQQGETIFVARNRERLINDNWSFW